MSYPTGIAFNAYQGTTYAYVTNGVGNNVSVCSLTTNGALTGCTTSDLVFSGPKGIAFHAYTQTS
jgi:DNA-binding beta-propeller fold protein YncE